MASPWSSAAAFTNSRAELGLVTVEQMRMLRNNNIITSKFMGESDARAQEMDDLNAKATDLNFKKIAAQKSREAADLGAMGAALNLLGTFMKMGFAANGMRDKNFSWATAFGDAVNGFGTLVSKLLEGLKAKAEEDAVMEDLTRLNAQRTQTDEATAALMANPYA